MAQLVGLVVSNDEGFKKHVARMLRGAAVPISIVDNRASRDTTAPDIIIVDIRGDVAPAMSSVERFRAAAPNAGIFAVAGTADPDLILQSMRAGANEFFVWPPADETFHEAVRRAAARREATQGPRAATTSLMFFGAKGGAGTTTLAVNCAVDIARLSKKATALVDLKPGLGEAALFLGIRPRYTVLDAVDNLNRLDREFLKELVVKHKSGLEILAGSDNFERPGSGDSAGIEELLRLLAGQYDYLVIDGGSQINACIVAGMYAADHIFLVANPDVPSIRNAQRLIERVRDFGACADRVSLLLNRAAEPFPIPPKQIETALSRPIYHMFSSDYKTVSGALNSGVPLALADDSDIAGEFNEFTKGILDPTARRPDESTGKRSLRGIEKIASIW
jgi:pilus assembly protein CpaE